VTNPTLPALRTSRRTQSLLVALALIVLGTYGYAASGPLRTVTSTVSDYASYIGTAGWLIDGRPADLHEIPWRNRELPVGYPGAIVILRACGLATPQGLLALNLISLAIGMAACWLLLQAAFSISRPVASGIALLVLSSTACCELSVTIASEMLFFALTNVTLLYLTRLTNLRRPLDWLAILLLCVALISVRTVGMAILPAVVWRAASGKIQFARDWKRLLLWAFPFLLLIGWYVARSNYVNKIIRSEYSSSTWDVLAWQQITKLSGFGELALNLHAEDFVRWLRPDLVFGGLLCVGLCTLGFWSRRRKLQALDIYIAVYAGILVVWPFFGFGTGRRYLFPLFPYVCGLIYLSGVELVKRAPALGKFVNRAGLVYLACFVLWGCLRSLEASTFERATDHSAAIALHALDRP
jgi:hypothetical protein